MFLLKFAGFAGIVLVKDGIVQLPKVPNASDFIFVYGIQAAMPSMFLWGIFAVIVLAAVMSTTDRLMLTIGTYFSWDIYKKILKPDAPDKQVLLVSQISVFVAAAVTLLLALNPPDMLVWLIWAGHRDHVCHLCRTPACRTVLAAGNPRRGACLHGAWPDCLARIWRGYPTSSWENYPCIFPSTHLSLLSLP